MKRRMTALICAVLMLAAMLAGCGAKEEPASQVAGAAGLGAVVAAPSAAAEPAESTYTVYVQAYSGWGTVRLWAWSQTEGNLFEAWPGEMMKMGSDGWYAMSIPTKYDYVIINGQDGDIQTDDECTNGRDIWFTIEADGYYVDVSEPAGITPEAEQPQDTYTVNAFLPGGWSDVSIWAWSDVDGDLFEQWPGDAMNDDGFGWYSYEVPLWVDNVIINGNGGSVQTVDLAVEPKDMWIVVFSDGRASVTYEDPAVVEDPWGNSDVVGANGGSNAQQSTSGYIAELYGNWESVHLQDGNLTLNVYALSFSETIYNCTQLTVNMDVSMNAGTSCKEWQLWGRSGSSFVKLAKIPLPAGDGFTSYAVTFDDPVSFDSLVVTPTSLGGYSFSVDMAITDVFTK